MKIAVLGTGIVGETLATRLVQLGHAVRMGARSRGNEKAVAWAAAQGAQASEGSFADAAAFGELVINATAGAVSLQALEAAGEANLAGKVLLDVANPIDLSRGMPLTLTNTNTDSLGETIQRRFPAARVVKALNTMHTAVMTDPGRVPGAHDVLLCGNDAAAKAQVVALLQSFGWAAPMDLGDISAARATEAMLPVWLRLWQTLGTSDFNFHIVR